MTSPTPTRAPGEGAVTEADVLAARVLLDTIGPFAIAAFDADVDSDADTLGGQMADAVVQLLAARRHEDEARGRAAGLEEAAKVVCGYCKRGVPHVDGGHFVNDGLQPKGEAGRIVRCRAGNIRALATVTPGEGQEE